MKTYIGLFLIICATGYMMYLNFSGLHMSQIELLETYSFEWIVSLGVGLFGYWLIRK